MQFLYAADGTKLQKKIVRTLPEPMLQLPNRPILAGTYRAQQIEVTGSIVSGQAPIVLEASQSIVFGPGFEAGAGAEFNTIINPALGGTTTTQDYVGGIEYKGSAIEAIYHAEGRCSPKTTGGWQYEYTLKDHLGNARLTFADQNGDGTVQTPEEILQENHYYPFGLNHSYAWMDNSSQPDNQYQYNGKELNEEFGLNWNDYGARWYDPAVGRFSRIDRFSGKYAGMSPYQYGANNPIKFIDVNGDSIKIAVGKNKYAYYNNGQVSNADGSQYVGKGTKTNKDGSVSLKGFLKKVTRDLDRISTGGAAGEGLVSSLSNSKRNVIIKNGGSNSTLGSTVTFNPNITEGGLNASGSTNRPSFIGLAHELVHAKENRDGQTDYSTWFSRDGNNIPRAEISTSNYENRIRAENNLPLRAYYTTDAYSPAALLKGNIGIYDTNNERVPETLPTKVIDNVQSQGN